MRRPTPRLATVLALLAASAPAMPAAARAGEPLFLRIRPPATDPAETRPEGNGAAVAPASAEDGFAAARARREAVWARSDARARLAIASICTGCLRAVPDARSPPLPPPAGSPERAAADPIADPGPAGPAPTPFAALADPR